MKLLLAACFAGCIIFQSACSFKPRTQGTVKSKNPLEHLLHKKKKLAKKGVLPEVSTAQSGDLQTAMDKVELESRAKLARSLETRISSLQKQFKEETGQDYADHFQQTVKSISSRVLKASTLTETAYQKTGKHYRAFGLMVMDSRLFASALEAEMQVQQSMKNRWLASRAYKALDKEVKEFERWKKAQPGPGLQ